MARQTFRGWFWPFLVVSTVMLGSCERASAESPQAATSSIIHKVQSASERQEMTVNTSRILTLDAKIPQAQVNNPDIVELTPLSPTEIQMSAKNPGVTQVNLWDENDRIYTIDVIVFGDARELSLLLESQFPNCALKVIPVSTGVLISGYVDQPEHVSAIVEIAEQYYPNVLKNMKVGGVHQVLLHVKVMEVSRTKLRALGFDWSQVSGSNMFVSSVAGLLTGVAGTGASTVNDTFYFQVIDGSDAFFGVLEALRQDDLMKVLAEPTLVAVSGRPAYFQVGGEFPILVPQSLGTVSIEFKKFGTQVDFVPIVLGNGRIRLEVRPRVSEIDNTRSVTVPGSTEPVPGLRVREVDTGVEMMAGQTLAIAGLVQSRIESQRRGLPWVSELPYFGAMFRRVQERNNEIELLITVTPEIVEAMNPEEVPQCGPGMGTASPNDWELYLKGYIEVPNCCPAGPETEMPGEMSPTDMPEMILEAPERLNTPQPSEPSSQPAKPVPTESTGLIRRQGAARRAEPLRQHNPSSRQTPRATSASRDKDQLPGFKGPIGYDVAK